MDYQAPDHQYQQNMPHPQDNKEGYSVAEANANRVAQAGHAAAQAAGANQKVAGKKVDAEALARMVAEENEAKGKLPRYPGLERYKLIEKMGDGAFSNVYKAVDIQGNAGEVAIKVVRKFEMNSSQVSLCEMRTITSPPALLTNFSFVVICEPVTTMYLSSLGQLCVRVMLIFIRISKSSQRWLRYVSLFFVLFRISTLWLTNGLYANTFMAHYHDSTFIMVRAEADQNNRERIFSRRFRSCVYSTTQTSPSWSTSRSRSSTIILSLSSHRVESCSMRLSA